LSTRPNLTKGSDPNTMSMKIKRTIQGEEAEIELTQDEIAEAYLHHEHYYDCEYVRSNLNSGCYEEFEDLTGEELEAAVHEIAYEKRRQQDKYELDEWDAMDVALEQYIKNHREPKSIVCGEHTFEVIDYIPRGYEFWNIGKNMTEGYLPLCRLSADQPFSGGRRVDVDSLKAIKLEGAQTVLAASIHGQTTVEAMEKYLKRYQGKKVGEAVCRQIKRIEAALEVLKDVKRSSVPAKISAEHDQIPACRFDLGDKVKIPYICDGDRHNGEVGEVTWLHPYKFYPEGDINNHVWKYQMEISYPDGQSIMADPDRKTSGVVSEVILVEAKSSHDALDNVIQSAASRAAEAQSVSTMKDRKPEHEI